jgi:hypothetical protein
MYLNLKPANDNRTRPTLFRARVALEDGRVLTVEAATQENLWYQAAKLGEGTVVAEISAGSAA